jgi:hypothetical protein
MRFHAIQNVETALRFLRYKEIKLVNIRGEDIVDGNPKLTLGLIWTIILHFQVGLVLKKGNVRYYHLEREIFAAFHACAMKLSHATYPRFLMWPTSPAVLCQYCVEHIPYFSSLRLLLLLTCLKNRTWMRENAFYLPLQCKRFSPPRADVSSARATFNGPRA